jgi:hypothetical protein
MQELHGGMKLKHKTVGAFGLLCISRKVWAVTDFDEQFKTVGACAFPRQLHYHIDKC